MWPIRYCGIIFHATIRFYALALLGHRDMGRVRVYMLRSNFHDHCP
jgi:hypothetical protein